MIYWDDALQTSKIFSEKGIPYFVESPGLYFLPLIFTPTSIRGHPWPPFISLPRRLWSAAFVSGAVTRVCATRKKVIRTYVPWPWVCGMPHRSRSSCSIDKTTASRYRSSCGIARVAPVVYYIRVSHYYSRPASIILLYRIPRPLLFGIGFYKLRSDARA